MKCFCRKGARCLPCIDRDGLTRTPPARLEHAELEAIVCVCIGRRPLPERIRGEIRRRGLVWNLRERRLMARPS